MSLESITVTVKLFAAFAEACGQSELRWQFPDGTTAIAIADRLYAQYPELEPWRQLTRYGVNLEFVEPDALLKEGDEVVLIPPVSGG
jgi:sulfur-carrier protein